MHDTIIVGAGAAGLAAGQTLHIAGRPALIVEARERMGGRIWTDRSHGPVELGAEFIHGEHAVTWSAMSAAGLRSSPWLGPRLFARDGRILPSDDPLIAQIYALYETANSYTGPELSAAALLAALAADKLASDFVLRWIANIEGADLARLSANALAREHATSTNGATNFHILDGYERVVAHLAAGLDIRLNSPVERVVWGGDGVQLELADGERLDAQQVLITVPLGVLQAGQPQFAPPLPPAKRAAIDAIAMGQVSKLVLWFERRFWPEFTVLSTDGAVSAWWPVESASTPTLMGYTGGPAALALAALGEAQAIETGLAELEALFGSHVRAAWRGGRLADWSQDPWSRGAYSYSPVGMGEARATLAAPLQGRLFFAGEATVLNGHLATVHGAIESGQRAAAELLTAQ